PQQRRSRCPAQGAQASGRGRCDAGPRAMKAALPACAAIGMVLFAACASAAPDDATVRAQTLVAKLTLKEKVAQLQADAPAIPRLGVPAYTWWNEGLHGLARGGFATVFPQAIGLAASWDPALLQQVGAVVSTEARARFN